MATSEKHLRHNKGIRSPGTLALAARLRYLQAYEFFLAYTGGLLHGLYI